MSFGCKIWLPGNNTWKLLHFRVLLPGNGTISGYCYPEIEVSLFLSCTISGYCYSEFDQFPIILGNCQFPGNNTQKFDNSQLSGNNTLKFSISEYCYSEIEKFPGNNTRKKYYFLEYPGENKNIFENIKVVNLGSRYYGFMKKKQT